MDTLHVYRLRWQRRVALTGAGALMGYGAFELLPHVFVIHHSYDWGQRGAMLGAMALSLGGLYTVLYAWIYKVILADDAITVVSVSFGYLATYYLGEERSRRISLCRAEIAGVVLSAGAALLPWPAS